MVADLREMQENQWVSEIWIDKPEFTSIISSLSRQSCHHMNDEIHCPEFYILFGTLGWFRCIHNNYDF